jgi:hypothetical protein
MRFFQQMGCASVLFLTVVGCASRRPPIVFAPQPSTQLACFYDRGMPFAMMLEDSAFLTLSLAPDVVAGVEYMRLGIFLRHRGHQPILFDPVGCAWLSMDDGKNSYEGIRPEPPHEMLANLKDGMVAGAFLVAVFTGLRAASVTPTTVDGPAGQRWVIHDEDAKQQRVYEQGAAQIAAYLAQSAAYSDAVDQGLLRKTTLLPGNAISGYVYFQLPTRPGLYGLRDPVNPSGYSFTIGLDGNLSRAIAFVPEAGQ